ncbi:MAG TPA: hypothetical protein VNY06_05050, partial [Methylocella sp.]|nr:hypothetical protein [Methylocella sp.]
MGFPIGVAKAADNCYAFLVTGFSAFGIWNSDNRRAFGLVPLGCRRAFACAFSGWAEELVFGSGARRHAIFFEDFLADTNRHTMSKGKDFRGPKKRGFDDDGPSPYDSPRM